MDILVIFDREAPDLSVDAVGQKLPFRVSSESDGTDNGLAAFLADGDGLANLQGFDFFGGLINFHNLQILSGSAKLRLPSTSEIHLARPSMNLLYHPCLALF